MCLHLCEYRHMKMKEKEEKRVDDKVNIKN